MARDLLSAPPVKKLLLSVFALAVTPLLAFGCDDGVASNTENATSCKGAKLDAKGKCRLPNGRFAKAKCCAGPVEQCDAPILAAIEACVTDFRDNDPDFDPSVTSGFDLYDQCSDPEVTAPARDARCEGSKPPAYCALDMDAFTSEYLPVCRVEATHRWLDGACVFGESYRDILDSAEAMVVVGRRQLTAGSSLTDLQRSQILSAVEATAHDVSTVEAAFEVVDDNVIFQSELWDASGRRGFTAYEMGAGDNSFGKIFVSGTTDVAATINDGIIEGCTTLWGNERRRCATDADCRGGTKCHGRPEGFALGRCIDPTLDTSPLETTACTVTDTSFGCPDGSGLVCAGAAASGEGLCLPGWMRGRFHSWPRTAIPDNKPAGVDASLLAYGLATVDMDIKLTMQISHQRIADLRVKLINPAGTEVIVFEGSSQTSGTEVYFDDKPVIGFSGDESVNGVWHLVAIDKKSGKTGSLNRFDLELTSRWD